MILIPWTDCLFVLSEFPGSTGDLLEKLLRIKISCSQDLHDHHLSARKHLPSDRFPRRIRSLHGRGSMGQNKIENGVSISQRRCVGWPADKDDRRKDWPHLEASPYICDSISRNLCEIFDLDPSEYDCWQGEISTTFAPQVWTTAHLATPVPTTTLASSMMNSCCLIRAPVPKSSNPCHCCSWLCVLLIMPF
jgi:hypothetical protein